MKPTFAVEDAMPHWHAVLLVQFTITNFNPEWTNRTMLSHQMHILFIWKGKHSPAVGI